jgi:hypothetical protein
MIPLKNNSYKYLSTFLHLLHIFKNFGCKYHMHMTYDTRLTPNLLYSWFERMRCSLTKGEYQQRRIAEFDGLIRISSDKNTTGCVGYRTLSSTWSVQLLVKLNHHCITKMRMQNSTDLKDQKVQRTSNEDT